jgi:uncharacterized protein YvpB
MTSITLTSTTTAVTLEAVETVSQTVSKNVTTYTFDDGTESLLDEGKNKHGIIISGYDKTNPVNRMRWMNTIMDNMQNVVVSGFDDTNFNTTYIILDFSFKQGTGEGAIPIYHYDLTLERIHDEV